MSSISAVTPGLPYDIGYGQKLFLRCRGRGIPTGVYILWIFRQVQERFPLFNSYF